MAWRLPPDQNAMGGVYGAQDMPLWLQSGVQEAPQLQPGAHLRNAMPMPRRVGIGESIANALLPRQDEQGNPRPATLGDAINAALWVIPGARGGTIKPGQFIRPEPPANFNRSPEGLARDKLRQELLNGKAKFEASLPPAPSLEGKPLSFSMSDIQEAIRRRLANTEALANGAQPNSTIRPIE